MPWGLVGIVIFLLALLTLAIASYQNRVLIAQWGLSKIAAKFDFSDARFKISHIEIDGLSLNDIWLGPDVSIGSFKIDYTLAGLMNAQLDLVEVSDVDIDISNPNSGVLAKIKKLSGGDQNSSSSPLAIPNTILKNLRVHGLIEGANLDFTIDAHIKPDLSGEFRTHGKAEHPLFAPLKISGSGLYAGSTLNFSFLGRDLEKYFSTHVEGNANVDTRTLFAKVTIPDVTFSPKGLQPKDLTSLAQLPFPLDTTLSAVAHLSWQNGTPEIKADISLKNTELDHGKTHLSISKTKADLHWPKGSINITLPKALISHADKAIEISALTAAAEINPKTGNIPFTIPKLNLRDTASPALFNPLQVSASGQLNKQRLNFKLATHLLKGPQVMQAQGMHSLKTGKGHVSLTIPQLNFDNNKLKPSDFTPSLSIIEETTGTISGQSHITWSLSDLKTKGRLALSDLSIRTDTVSVKGIKANLQLSNLWPPRTSKAQTIQIKEISSGVAFDAPKIRFSIKGATLNVHKLDAGFLGGNINVQDMVVDPNTKLHKLILNLNHLDLTKLFSLIELEGLAGTGKMTGTLPITISGDDITLKDGLLISDGPGVLQFRSAKAKQALAGAGEQVELLLSVLTDFHYDKLSLTLKRERSHDAYVGLHIEGRNPAVMDGRAFNLNINLEGNVDPLLATILEGYRLSDRAIRASLR